jgi:hypothetical protein
MRCAGRSTLEMATDLLSRQRSESPAEENDVVLWRLEQFQTLGFTEIEAFALSHSDADLGRARLLQKTDCPLDLALRILL